MDKYREFEIDEDSLCENCIYLLHYKYDREVDISCQKGHEAKFYPPILECSDFRKDNSGDPE